MKKVFFFLLALLMPLNNILPVNLRGKGNNLSQLDKNIILNGSFEAGTVSPWKGIDASNLSDLVFHQGNYSVKISKKEAYQEWIKVIPGTQYTLTAWFKWNSFGNDNWGYDHISVHDQEWNEISAITHLHELYTQYNWHKVALTFTPKTETIRISFGVFGPVENIELYFDDFKLFVKTENANPVIDPKSKTNRTSIQSPIQFFSNAEDADGAISYFFWDFGDGSSSTISDPTHTYLQRGEYEVGLTAVDNDGGISHQGLKVTITDRLSPIIVFDTAGDTLSTAASEIEITGKAFASSGRQISSLVWDNINTDRAESVDSIPNSIVNWSIEKIDLKPGTNTILFTATDTLGAITTQKLEIFREIENPETLNISINSTEISVYEKLEIQFDLLTTAATPFFSYEENPPSGVQAQTGVSVEGRFLYQDGSIYKQPGFFTNKVEIINSYYHETPEGKWMIRFSPQKTGKYRGYIHVEDSSGETIKFVGDFLATAPGKPGYIQVSQADPRYFEFSNKTLFWPTGPAYEENLEKNLSSGLNFSRIWFAGKGVYSSNFARWVSSSKTMGNEGFDSQLSFKEHFPGHELSQAIYYPEAKRIWIGWPNTEINGPKFKTNTDYLVKIRLKTQNITGPVDPDTPYGFMIKRHGWPSSNLEASLRSIPSLIPAVQNDRDWHTILATYHSGQESFFATPYLGLFLDNVSSGEVFIDQFSIREILSNGQLGEELIINSKSDLHTYVSSKPALYFDNLVTEGEQNQVFFKFVVHDKRDWINNHLTRYGYFHDNGDGYFQAKNTKSRWLLEQWWRYLIARWGYSTAVHSWELINEGPPRDLNHYQMANDFAQFMHETDAHPHLATTSFWSGWELEFWKNDILYPDMDYADFHLYANPDSIANHDGTTWLLETQQYIYEEKINKPIISGEIGLFSPESDLFSLLENTNPGIWYHKLLWSQLSPEVFFAPNYWWSEHLSAFQRETISRPFSLFIKEIPLNQGGFSNAQASSNNHNIGVLGQKNIERGMAYLWVRNINHTWRNNAPVSPETGVVTLQLIPNADFTLEIWDTYSGSIQRIEQTIADHDGNIGITVDQLQTDLAIKITIKP